jgi:hypothetical protein
MEPGSDRGQLGRVTEVVDGRSNGNRQTTLLALGKVCVLAVFAVLIAGAPNARSAECPNEEFRTGESSDLPACRAYELVSPPDSNGRIVGAINTFEVPPKSRELFPTELAAPDGTSIVFMTYMSPLPELRGATGVGDVYEAKRGGGGWSTEMRLGPGGAEATQDQPGGVAEDHSYMTAAPGPGPLAVEGHTASYLFGRDDSVELAGLGHLGVEPFAQTRYIGAGGQHVIFSTGNALTQSNLCGLAGTNCKVRQLEEDAPPTGTGAVYDRSADGPTHVVSLLPVNVRLKAGEQAFYKGNSRDGSSIAFEANGTLYVRIDSGSESGEATLKATEGSPVYAGLSDQGRYLFYVPGGEKGTIHRFDTVTKADAKVNPTAAGEIVNVSGDGSHVYFISEEQIGGEGVSGGPNLYVWSGGTSALVATVAKSDLEETSPLPGSGAGIPALTRWTSWVTNPNQGGLQGPGADSSRTTPDGTVLVFESRAQLTSYDNTEIDASACGDPEKPGEGCTEIYRYAEGSGLTCVSCNFGHPAGHDARLQELEWINLQTIVHNVSEDGSRVFFETAEPLVARDSDGLNDIYEWQEGFGAGGSVDLISSGHSVPYPEDSPIAPGTGQILPPPNLLLSVTPDGGDVAFLARDPLVEGAPEGGATAIYDARIGGGFPNPVSPQPCAEERCKPAAGSGPASTASGTASGSLRGSGNVKPRRHHRHCRGRKRHKAKRCARKREHRSALNLAGASASSSSIRAAAAVPAPGSQQPPSAPVPSLTAETGSGFGFESAAAGLSSTGAGSHPDFTTAFVLDHQVVGKELRSDNRTEEVRISLPPGLLGNPDAVSQCRTADLLTENCPIDSQVGVTTVSLLNHGNPDGEWPIYNLKPPHPGLEVARFGFTPLGTFPAFIDVKVRTAGDYGVTATVYGTSGFDSLIASHAILWGDPSDPAHDPERLPEELCKSGKFDCSVPRTGLAFMTNPSACQVGQVGFLARSYQLPGQLFTADAAIGSIIGCTGLPFAPALDAEPTSHVAGAPTGLRTKLVIPQHLLAGERATATMREARVTLPPGMQVAAGAANWIGTCSEAQVGYHEEADTACPDAAKLGTATIVSPLLPEPIEGTIYQRSPRLGHQLGLWLTADALGLHIKLPGELEPDKTTGRLTAAFRDLPQVPVEEIDLNVWGGPRAPLQNPDRCGAFTTDFSFTPHSDDPAASGQSTMQITEGCNQGFSPTLDAGVTKPRAGRFSPFVFDLNREDGQQALRGFELKLPDGELAKLKGVPLCPDANASAGTCPQASRIGSLQATTGPGPEPLTLPQPGRPQPQIYLAGRYQGAPFSILSEVPAQAGPFDLGVLAVRSGLDVEPETARAVVRADPLPQFFEGIGIAYRHLHAVVDRPRFSLNPTDCREAAVTSDVTSTQGTVAHPSARFQVDGCKALRFKPRLSLKLRGGTERADYPALTAILEARRGDANIAFASVALPHSEFLAQEHIATICTRKQFAAEKCPKRSVYGNAKAWTPLLGKPLSGPVYLRSSDHPLPDLVAKLGGQLEIDLVGRIDSMHGGIRTTFESVPDAPVSRFVLQMKGGAKGLLTNSTDICRGAHRASVAMRAQNGRAARLRPTLQSSGCGKKKLGKQKKHH